MATSVFAAVGDKVYFVDSQSWGAIYVTEYDDSWNAQYGTAVSEGWQYGGKDVYVYTIQSDASTTVSVKLDGSHYTDPAIAIEAGCYYTIDAGGSYYWLTKYYYNEFYFMDNNWAVFNATPNIVLYNVDGETWTAQNAWPGDAMTAIGTVTMNEISYAAYKFVGLSALKVTNVNFNYGETDWSVAVEAGKKYYSWDRWYTYINEIANPVQLVGDEAITGADWGSLEANQMWWNSTSEVFEVTRNNVHITTGEWYNFRVYLATSGDNYNAVYPKAGNGYVELTPGVYSLYFTYNPATDALTCTPTACYSRNVGAADKWGTICLPNPSTAVSGATFYTVAGKEGSSILLEEITGNLEAGHPYIFQSTAEWVNVTLNASSYENAWSNYNGLCGSYVEYAITPAAGNYLLHDGQFYEAIGENAKVGQYRAFLTLSNVPAVSPAPGRRYVRMTVNGENTATGIEETGSETANAVRSEKRIVNGQLLIIRNGEKYNAQGVTVK